MHFLINRSDGGVSIMHVRDGEDEAVFISKWQKGSASRGWTVSSYRPIAIDDIPNDRNFRDAWRDGGSTVEVDMPKARVIHMDRIRVARDAALDTADNDLKTAEDNNDMPEIALIRNRRRTLRDIPATFDLSGATTPDALDALWPADLPARTP